MDAYLIFGAENNHPLAWILNKRCRHVWCVLADHDAGMWVSYNWHQGLPVVRVEAALDFDIGSYYIQAGWNVVDLSWLERSPVQGLFILNNCVGHVKSVLGIGGFSLVPNQLLKYVTRSMPASPTINRGLLTVPGFGSSSTPPAPTHYSDGTPIISGGGAPKSANTIAAEKTLAEQRKLAGGGDETSGTLLTDEDEVQTKLGGEGQGGGKSFAAAGGVKGAPRGISRSK
jgi:hypothetical protein